MALEYLFDRQRMLKVVLVYTPSTSLSIFVQDAIKSRYGINLDNIRTINSQKELNATREIYNIMPFLSDRWLFHVPKADKIVKKTFLKLQMENTSGVYLLEFENYKSYKFAKDLLSKQQGVLDLYLAWLRRDDFQELYKRIVIANNGSELPKTLLDFVMKGYSSEIDALFLLFDRLKEKQEIKSRKDIIEICGLSANTIDSFMFSLLKEPTVSDKGLKKYMANRLKEAVDLSEKYTWLKFRNYLIRSVKTCIEIKMILSSGEVYDNIRNYENENYNINQIKKYQRHLPKIKEISMTRFLGLLECLNRRIWREDMDFLDFFFNYMIYKYEANVEVKGLIMSALTAKGEPKKKKEVKQKPISKEQVSDIEKDRLKTREMFNERLGR